MVGLGTTKGEDFQDGKAFDLGSGTNTAVPSYTPDQGSTPLCLVSGQAICLLSLDTQGALLTVTTSGSKSQRPEG